MPQTPQYATVDVSAAFADAVVFTLPAILSPWARAQLPVLDSLYLDMDAAIAVDLYLAPVGVAFVEPMVVPLIRGTVQHESRFCYPIPIEPVSLVPWQLRMTKAAGAVDSAFVRLAWSLGGC